MNKDPNKKKHLLITYVIIAMTVITAVWAFILFPLSKKQIDESGSKEDEFVGELFEDLRKTNPPAINIENEEPVTRPNTDKKETEPPQARLKTNSNADNEVTTNSNDVDQDDKENIENQDTNN